MATTLRPPNILIKEVKDIYAQENWYKLKLYLEKLQIPTGTTTPATQIITSSPVVSRQGWRFIQDTAHTPSSPLEIPANTRTLVTLDDLGALSSVNYGNPDSLTWWDAVTSTFKPSRLGDFFDLQLNLLLQTKVNNTTVLLEVSNGTATSIFKKDFEVNRGAGKDIHVSEDISLPTDADTLANGVQIFITSPVPVSIHTPLLIGSRVI